MLKNLSAFDLLAMKALCVNAKKQHLHKGRRGGNSLMLCGVTKSFTYVGSQSIFGLIPTCTSHDGCLMSVLMLYIDTCLCEKKDYP